MMARVSHGLVLAVHPTSRGFGWVLFEGPMTPVDWGLATAKTDRNSRSLARFERLLDRYQPCTAVLEAFEDRASRRHERIQELYKQMIAAASKRDVRVAIYDRDTIRRCFEHSGKRTRHGIALSIADQIALFRHRLPRERRSWESEDARQSLFDAVALALTHFAMAAKTDGDA